MYLFGAASTGVNPQSGSYLSREERIAMFKNASGRRGYAGRSAGGGGGAGEGEAAQRANVQATSAIVAVNSMTSTIQQLQVTNQESVEQVQVQVEKNRQDIATLFTNIAEAKQAELVEEKTQTRQDRRRIELGLRAGAENMIEGLGKAVKKTASALGSVAQKTLGPVRGFLDKLFELLGLLGAAWAIDNLPAILNTIDDFTANIPSVGEALENALNFLTGTRGVFTILDMMFQPLKNILGKIAGKAIDTGAWIARKTGDIVRKIFTKVKNFVVELFSSLKRRLTNLLKNLNPFKVPKPPKPPGTGVVDDAVETGIKGADEAVDATQAAARANQQVLDEIAGSGKYADEAADVAKNVKPNRFQQFFGGLKDNTKKLLTGIGDSTGNILDGLGKKMTDAGFNPMAAVKSTPKEQVSTLEKVLGPFAKIFGLKNLKNMVKFVAKIPGIGILVDALINNQLDNMGWGESLFRAIGSNFGGAVGLTAGLKAGGLGGAFVGSLVLPGIGSVVGGALGAAIGGFLGAALGGAFGDSVMKATMVATGVDPTQNDVMFGERTDNWVKGLGNMFGADVDTDIEGLNQTEIDNQGKERPRIELTGLDTGNEDIDGAVNKVLDFKLPATNLSSLLQPSEGSTPEGMELSSDAKSADESSLDISELPPNFIDQSSMPMTRMEEPKGQAQAIPDFDTADPTMDAYRTTAQLLFEVAS